MDSTKEAFLDLIAKLDDSQFHEFEQFARSAMEEYHGKIHNHDDDVNDLVEDSHIQGFQPVSDAKMSHLARMIQDLRKRVPISAEAPGEKIVIPDSKEYADYTDKNTVHVDGFLFSEDDVDELCDEGKLSRNYCLDCQSTSTKPLNFISHSASVLQLQFLYQVVLADKVKDKVIVDVGSRLGAVLYTGFLFTRARKIIGVELNEWFCKLQQDMVQKYRMSNRVEVRCNDIRKTPELLSKDADVVIMNNVFQFFNELPVQQEIWNFIRTETSKRPGLLLVTLPSLQDQLKEAGLPATKTMRGWVKEVKLDYENGEYFQSELNQDEIDEISQVHLYKVVS